MGSSPTFGISTYQDSPFSLMARGRAYGCSTSRHTAVSYKAVLFEQLREPDATYRVLFELALETGMRRRELLAVTWGVGPTGEKRTFHTLRHTFARIAIENNRPIFWLSKHLGHSSLDVTSNVYGHFEKATRRPEAEAMAGVLGV